jgi:CRISPR-associated endonuclease/helicase Cas3
LKRALTRKNVDPDQGVKDFCISEDIFECAEKLKFRDIEIVVVASPVIETGNDLDFDYAILDPISMRSIIQASGRVRRHRPAKGSLPNILIFGRSPIAMEGGILSQPGVETPPAPETRVERVSLNNFEGRHFADLCGDETFGTISAASLISGDGVVPLRDAEAILRGRMINPAPSSPFGKYVTHTRSRFTLAPTRKRKFRRSDTRSIDYVMIGDKLREAQWYVDLAPGTRDSALQLAANIDLSVIAGSHAFSDVTEAAWFDYGESGTEMSPYDIKNLMRVSIPDYSRDITSPMTYTEFTGFTRGSSEDLFRAFGKSN